MNQFIVYRRIDKVPSDFRTGLPANAQDPSNWTDVANASAIVDAWGSDWGIGFVLTEQSHIGVVDVDGCRNPESGEISLVAQALIAMLPGAYVEVSISGRGIHIWFTYSGQMPPHASRAAGVGEFYHKDRYICIGAPYEAPGFVNGSLAADLTQWVPSVIATFFPPDTVSNGESDWTTEAVPEWWGPESDDEIVRRAMNSKSTASAFGGKASFSDLWLANEAVLSKSYPDPVRTYDASAADAALCQHLAFWVGSNAERIQRIIERPDCMLARDKWDREDYLPRTILGAVSRQTEWLQDERPVAAAPIAEGVVSHAPTKREGDGYCTLEQQPEHFAGCVYIKTQNRALLADGSIVKPEVFKVVLGGKIFKMDSLNEKTSRDAWEAFTQSQVYKPVMVDGLNFKPNLPPRAITTQNNQTFINSYVPVDIERKQGDVSPFLTHLAKVLPDERDRAILLSYMAACVQHQGIKFQWAPLLQGVEGNGKTLFSRVVEHAVGERYTHWVTASKLSSTFNSWLEGKVFYAVEDIYVPDSKREIFEDLKPMVTNDTIEIEAKGVDKVSVEVCGNFMFNSNHRDAIRKTENDRRICILFSAQQQRSDLERDGMGGDYFPNLYKWLREDGYAIVAEYLYTYAITDALNPAVDCQRAPITTSTAEAIGASAGNVEQEIQEAIEQGLPGFCGGWVSSTWLERLLEAKGFARKISHHKRKAILEQMGYKYHPALKEGRVNNTVLPDNTKPRLFIHSSSLAAQIPYAIEAVKNYETANMGKMALPFAQARG